MGTAWKQSPQPPKWRNLAAKTRVRIYWISKIATLDASRGLSFRWHASTQAIERKGFSYRKNEAHGMVSCIRRSVEMLLYLETKVMPAETTMPRK